VPSQAIRTGSARANPDVVPLWFSPRRYGWSYRDAGGVALAVAGIGAVVINALFMQPGPHPAPIFTSVLLPVAVVEAKDTSVGAVPSPVPKTEPLKKVEPAKPETPAVPKTAAETITEIQRELARRGFYDGAVDGLYGSKTDTAIRDFEHTAGLKPSAEPNVALLRSIKTSNAKAAKPSTTGTGLARPTPLAPVPPAPVPPTRSDPINDALAPSKRIVAVQRALADYGYGQIRPSGVLDRETKSAIERFERERKLPVTGALSDRLARELTAVTGRPLE
jgi:peptidoglycan hydrolase-like protein with peptidoglycan-binding domain